MISVGSRGERKGLSLRYLFEGEKMEFETEFEDGEAYFQKNNSFGNENDDYYDDDDSAIDPDVSLSYIVSFLIRLLNSVFEFAYLSKHFASFYWTNLFLDRCI